MIHFCGFPIGYLFYKDRLNDWVVLRIKQIDWLIMRDVIRYVPVFLTVNIALRGFYLDCHAGV
jgi:hypothetical protein